jgi:hypothetical protein
MFTKTMTIDMDVKITKEDIEKYLKDKAEFSKRYDFVNSTNEPIEGRI